LALPLLYEIHASARCQRVQEFVSSGRWVKCPRPSAGKNCGTSGHQIGPVPLKGAFAEAAVLLLRHNPKGQPRLARLEHQHGQEKALTLLAHQLARAVSFRLRREKALDLTQFLAPGRRQAGEPTASLDTAGGSPWAGALSPSPVASTTLGRC
jgi:hypothetical protein